MKWLTEQDTEQASGAAGLDPGLQIVGPPCFSADAGLAAPLGWSGRGFQGPRALRLASGRQGPGREPVWAPLTELFLCISSTEPTSPLSRAGEKKKKKKAEQVQRPGRRMLQGPTEMFSFHFF